MITTATIDRLGKRCLQDLRLHPSGRRSVWQLAATEGVHVDSVWIAMAHLKERHLVRPTGRWGHYAIEDTGRLVAL